MENDVRPLHELYNLLHKAMIDIPMVEVGICHYISLLFRLGTINKDEFYSLKIHFLDNKPSDHLHSEFTCVSSWIDFIYWWSQTEDGYEQRLKFITKMIEITKNK